VKNLAGIFLPEYRRKILWKRFKTETNKQNCHPRHYAFTTHLRNIIYIFIMLKKAYPLGHAFFALLFDLYIDFYSLLFLTFTRLSSKIRVL